jgi:hypothetical protein
MLISRAECLLSLPSRPIISVSWWPSLQRARQQAAVGKRQRALVASSDMEERRRGSNSHADSRGARLRSVRAGFHGRGIAGGCIGP